MQKKSIGFGARGWVVVIYQFLAFLMYVCINNFGQNVMANANAGRFGWNATNVPTIYTIMSIAAVVLQFIVGKKIANSGKVKVLSIGCLALAGVLTIGAAVIHSSEGLWLGVWGASVFFSILGATFLASTIVGQWFPRRKGTVMGIATLAFPICNGVALTLFTLLLGKAHGNMLVAWLPFLAFDLINILLCIFVIKEYPEQCGAYPDNDRSMTPEVMKAMAEKQMAARKNSVWNLKNTLRTVDFWLITVPQGILLLGSIGAMTQVMKIMSQFGFVEFGPQGPSQTATGAIIFLMNAAIACLGSWILGMIDTKFGTKVAIAISCVFMVVSGILCTVGTVNNQAVVFLIGFGCLQIYMGASSNFTVSSAAQYWKREDFPSAFSFINPLANLICAFGPIVVAGIGAAAGFKTVWIVIGCMGIVALGMTLAFKPARILAADKKYRKEAGLPEEGLSKSAAEIMGEK